MTRIWVDIDNPPQAQYLSPVARELRARGCDVLVTARDHTATIDVLRQRGEEPHIVGSVLGASRVAKTVGTLGRVPLLARAVVRELGRPDAVVSTARGGVLTAAALRVPAFTVLDYEGVELAAFRWSGTTLLHPDVVPAERFTERGFPADRLVSFPGLKEDLTFAGIETDLVPPAMLPPPSDPALQAVLVRPPSQTSHYRVDESVLLLGAVLDAVAPHPDLQVVFSPREPDQVALLDGRQWTNPPVVLHRPLPFVGLLKAVSWVVTGGGTMLREAAWMGVPGVTVYQGAPPAADEWLEVRGMIRRVGSPSDASDVPWADPQEMPTLERHPEALSCVVALIQGGARSVRRT